MSEEVTRLMPRKLIKVKQLHGCGILTVFDSKNVLTLNFNEELLTDSHKDNRSSENKAQVSASQATV